MCLTIGVILPQTLHIIPNAGSILLPMHIPVLIGGTLLGPYFGFLNGLLTPILSHLLFAMPPAIMLGQMIIELSVYGLSSGFLYHKLKIKNQLLKNYLVLIISMLTGRLAYGLANAIFFKAGSYSLKIWLQAAFITSLPGIIIQLAIIPFIIISIKKIVANGEVS